MNPKKTTTDRPALTLCPDPASKAQRMNYILVDYENVQPHDLSRITRDHFQLIVVVGHGQTSLRLELTEFALKNPDQLRLVRTPCIGKNALDFVLTYEVGQILATDPTACIHIISKDNDFKSIVSHLKANDHFCARHADIAAIPLLLRTDERFDRLVAHLSDPTKPRPQKHKTLVNVIQQYFEKTLELETVEKTIKLLVRDKVLKISKEGKIEYA